MVERARVSDQFLPLHARLSREISKARVLVLGQHLVSMHVEGLTSISLGHDAFQLVLIVLLSGGSDL